MSDSTLTFDRDGETWIDAAAARIGPRGYRTESDRALELPLPPIGDDDSDELTETFRQAVASVVTPDLDVRGIGWTESTVGVLGRFVVSVRTATRSKILVLEDSAETSDPTAVSLGTDVDARVAMGQTLPGVIHAADIDDAMGRVDDELVAIVVSAGGTGPLSPDRVLLDRCRELADASDVPLAIDARRRSPWSASDRWPAGGGGVGERVDIVLASAGWFGGAGGGLAIATSDRGLSRLADWDRPPGPAAALRWLLQGFERSDIGFEAVSEQRLRPIAMAVADATPVSDLESDGSTFRLTVDVDPRRWVETLRRHHIEPAFDPTRFEVPPTADESDWSRLAERLSAVCGELDRSADAEGVGPAESKPTAAEPDDAPDLRRDETEPSADEPMVASETIVDPHETNHPKAAGDATP